MMVVQQITDLADLERLRQQWDELWRGLEATTPFQSPAWLIPWWKHIGRGELWVLVVRELDPAGRDSRLVGLVPLYIYTRPGTGLREVFPIGIGTTDYLDGLFAPDCTTTAAEAIFTFLDEHHDRWDVCDLPQLPAESSLRLAVVPPHWRDEVCKGEPCPVLQWRPGIQNLHECIPSSFHKRIRQLWRHAEALGARLVTLDEANGPELLNAWFHLHHARRAALGEASALDDLAVRGMHEEALPELLHAGIARMWALRVDGELIAVLYGLADHPDVRVRRFYYYLGSFDPRYDRLSPGKLLVAHALEQAIREGACEFDFLRGRESYKYQWGACDRPTYRRRLR